MHHERTIYGTVHVESRERNSANGNPRFRVYVVADDKSDSVSALTKPDSSLAYGIENRENAETPRNWRVGIYRGKWHVEEGRA